MTSTLLIIGRNRREQFRFTLDSIKGKKYQDIQAIYVDDSSTDNIPQITDPESDWLRYECLHRPGGYRENPSWAINCGHRFVSTDICIEQSAEVCHLTDCVTPLVNICRPSVVAIARVFCGSVGDYAIAAQRVADGVLHAVPDYEPEHIESTDGRINPPVVEDGFELFTGQSRPMPFFFMGAIHRSDFEAVGGYNENLPNRNDQDLADRLIARGTRFVFSGSALAFHLHHGKT